MRLLSTHTSSPKPPISNEVDQVLRKVGSGLLLFGLVDIGAMIYCISNGLSYSSSFNIFAVISGIYLRRGHPWYVKWVTRASGFYAAAFCMMAPVALLVFPFDLIVLELRQQPAAIWAGAALYSGVVAFLIWVYRELRQPAVLAAFAGPEYSPGPFWRVPAFGAAFALCFGVLFLFLMHSDAQLKAIELAKAKTAPGHRYFVTQINYSGDRGRARVLAYDDREIQTIDVAW